MKTRIFSGFVSPLLFALLCGGCATHYLWTNPALNHWNEPADQPHVRLFQADRDILVSYDEYSESRDAVRARAYLLEENRSRIEQRQQPAFVRTTAFRSASPIPLVGGLPCTNAFPFAVLETNRQTFVVFPNAQSTNRCELPVYSDVGKDTTKKVLLTPIFVTADLTIVGGYLGYWYLQGKTGVAGYNPSY